ncbi:MAG: biotin/lipoate A/B protein ligase family protein [Thermofilaceae archaeon]
MVKLLRVVLFETPHDPYMNLAFEEAFTRVRGAGLVDDTLRIWRNDKAVVIGYFQKAEDEIDMESASKLGVKVVRRFSGGGAVYHDLGNVNYALAVDGMAVPDPVDYVYTNLIRGALNALKLLGCEPYIENVNDIVAGGRKVSGTAASFRWNVCFIHGTLLLNTDLTALSKVLKPPREKLLAKGVSEVKYRVTNLSELLGKKLSYKEVIEALVRGFEETLGAETYFDMPSSEELNVARLLYEQKYSNPHWNLNRVPHSVFQKIEEELQSFLSSKA